MTEPGDQRETFSSVWGMVLALLGVSIGLGNFWRFPYMMGIFGGGAFLSVYLLVVAVVGVPAMLAELTLGRATRRGPMGAFEGAGLGGGRAVGLVLFLGVAMAMTYYLVVLGWLLAFSALSLGWLLGWVDLSAASFSAFHDRWPLQVLCAALVAGAAATVVGRGVQRGIERISGLFLPTFGLLTVLLAAWSLTLPGAGDAVAYLLDWDWTELTPRAILAAVGQAFFSLGLGGTFLVIYGSYLPDETSLPRRALGTAAGDVMASLLAVLVIMPVALSFGLSPASGPPLLFEVMPVAFNEMPGGGLFALLFFVGLTCIAFLSGVAAIEVLVGSMTDAWGWRRQHASWAIGAALVVMGLPAMFSLDYIVWSDLIWGSTMQPVGSVAAVVALTWGLGREPVARQLAAEGRVPRWVHVWFVWLRYGVPVAVVAALVSGWFA